jgi:hypothetical protein
MLEFIHIFVSFSLIRIEYHEIGDLFFFGYKGPYRVGILAVVELPIIFLA